MDSRYHKLSSESSVPEQLDVLKTVEGDTSSEHCVGRSATSIGSAAGNSGLTIADRALMRRFGSQETKQEHLSQPGGISAKVAAGKRSEAVHIPEEIVSLRDRILLRKYSEVPSASASTVGLGVVGTTSVPSCSVEGATVYSKKRRRFVGKGNMKAYGIGTDVREPQLRCTGSLLNIQRDESSSGTFPPKISPAMLDFARLYYTLVRDGALPIGYLDEFLTLELPARRATKRSRSFACSISDAAAASALSNLRQEAQRKTLEVSSISDQLVIAADLRPKKFRTRWQRAVYDGPTARKDAEAAERDRWIQLLSNLLRSSETLIGKLIRESPSNVQLLGGGRRAGTLRSRVRSVQKFLGWLIAAHGINFPNHWRQFIEYLQVRYSEPCVRGALKLVHFLVHLLTGGGQGLRTKLTGHSVVRSVTERASGPSDAWKGPRSKRPDSRPFCWQHLKTQFYRWICRSS